MDRTGAAGRGERSYLTLAGGGPRLGSGPVETQPALPSIVCASKAHPPPRIREAVCFCVTAGAGCGNPTI